MAPGVSQACSRCRKQKRKCDKIFPVCSLCKRLRQKCIYAHNTSPVDDKICTALEKNPLISAAIEIKEALQDQITSNIGDPLLIRQAAANYFGTIHQWFPVLSETRYHSRLVSSLQVRSLIDSADFNLLTLSMYLVSVRPGEVGDTSTAVRKLPNWVQSLYTLLKSSVAGLESLGMNSLDMLQARLLLNVFEVGHALYPAAYISAGSNLRASAALEADSNSFAHIPYLFQDRAQEARRTSQGILILDRFINLEKVEVPKFALDTLVDDFKGNEFSDESIDSPTARAFEDLFQASQLLGRILAHLHGTGTHGEAKIAEALQILRSLTNFFGKFANDCPGKQITASSAMAVCRSAMMEVTMYGGHVEEKELAACKNTSKNMLRTTCNDICQGAAYLTSNPSIINLDALPVFAPRTIYTAIIALSDVLNDSDQASLEVQVRHLKLLLRHCGLRWGAASHYMEMIEAAASV